MSPGRGELPIGVLEQIAAAGQFLAAGGELHIELVAATARGLAFLLDPVPPDVRGRDASLGGDGGPHALHQVATALLDGVTLRGGVSLQFCDFRLTPSEQGTGDRCAEQIFSFVGSAGTDKRPQIVGDELLT